MRKYPLIGASIIVVVLIVLGSLNNIVGYQTVQASNQKIINSEIDQKELLFQTIVDMMNNKEIQKVILGSEITGKRFFEHGMKFSVFAPPVLTEKYLKHAYTMGVIFSKTLSKSKIHSMLEQYQVNNQMMQREISNVVEKDTALNGEMTQLLDLKCDCGNENISQWSFPILCTILYPIAAFLWVIVIGAQLAFNVYPYFFAKLLAIMFNIASTLNCFWGY